MAPHDAAGIATFQMMFQAKTRARVTGGLIVGVTLVDHRHHALALNIGLRIVILQQRVIIAVDLILFFLFEIYFIAVVSLGLSLCFRRDDRRFIIVDHAGPATLQDRLRIERRPTRWADDRLLIQIEIASAARLTDTLNT